MTVGNGLADVSWWYGIRRASVGLEVVRFLEDATIVLLYFSTLAAIRIHGHVLNCSKIRKRMVSRSNTTTLPNLLALFCWCNVVLVEVGTSPSSTPNIAEVLQPGSM